MKQHLNIFSHFNTIEIFFFILMDFKMLQLQLKRCCKAVSKTDKTRRTNPKVLNDENQIIKIVPHRIFKDIKFPFVCFLLFVLSSFLDLLFLFVTQNCHRFCTRRGDERLWFSTSFCCNIITTVDIQSTGTKTRSRCENDSVNVTKSLKCDPNFKS